MTQGMVRMFWLLGGFLFTGLAFIGVALPLVPTTPFLLLAAFCFSRSSKRFNDWLYNHRMFGPLLVNWNRYGAIGPRAKISAIACMIATPVLSYFLGAKLWVVACQIPVLLGSAIFILTRPNGPLPGAEAPDEVD